MAENHRGHNCPGKKQLPDRMIPAIGEGANKQDDQGKAAKAHVGETPCGLDPVGRIQAIMPVAKIPEHHGHALSWTAVEPQVHKWELRARLQTVGVMGPEQKENT